MKMLFFFYSYFLVVVMSVETILEIVYQIYPIKNLAQQFAVY